jgi:hypothetical protein
MLQLHTHRQYKELVNVTGRGVVAITGQQVAERIGLETILSPPVFFPSPAAIVKLGKEKK